MKIVIAGGTGFIGRHVSEFLAQEGHTVVVLSRHQGPHDPSDTHTYRRVPWDGQGLGDWSQECQGADAVINLSGAPIADSRWTPARKKVLTESRVQTTKVLLRAIKSWPNKPHTFITASGVGFYGNRKQEWLDEMAPAGTGFLAELCLAWEHAAMEGESLGLRVVPIRIGMVLGSDGGALPKMMFPFRMFLGGPVLPGSQFVSWIHREDLARLILFLITHPAIKGPVNAVAPGPVTMRDFCASLGKALKRPSWLPVPGFILRLTLGELSSMLTTGQRVQPKKALDCGFSFTYGTLSEAFHSLFQDPATRKRSGDAIGVRKSMNRSYLKE